MNYKTEHGLFALTIGIENILLPAKVETEIVPIKPYAHIHIHIENLRTN